MTYLPTMGSIDASNFNSTKYPGICKPTNRPTLDSIVEMQNQLNRVAQKLYVTKIAPDGDVGPATVGLFGKVRKIAPVLAPMSNCIDVAQNADLIADAARAFANMAGVPATVSAPKPSRPPSFLNAATGADIAVPNAGGGGGASLTDAFKGMSTTTMAVLGAVAVAVGYFLTRGKMKKPGARRYRSVRHRRSNYRIRSRR